MSLIWDSDFSTQELKTLQYRVPKLYIIEKYPPGIKPFYKQRADEYTYSFDVYYETIELASGGLREHREMLLRDQLASSNISAMMLEWYLDNFKYGSRPHGGFGMGLGRLYKVLLGLTDIRDTAPFPCYYGGNMY